MGLIRSQAVTFSCLYESHASQSVHARLLALVLTFHSEQTCMTIAMPGELKSDKS